MLEIIKAIIYGIVEGITEWLPISSTGHMILLEKIMPMEVSEEFWSMFLVVVQLGLLDSVWALVLPTSINVFNMLLLLSFFRQIPGDIEDAAFIDGAGHWRLLWQIYVPISVPVIATVTLFTLVQHWNSWFDGLIYMQPENYPLQTYLRSIIYNFDFSKLTPEEQARLAQMNVRSVKSAQMVMGAIPILAVYPFLQKYFVSGITLGSVKG